MTLNGAGGVLLRLKRLVGVLALCVACVFVAAPPSLAQRGGVVTAIVIEGNSRVEPDTIRSYVAIQVGQPYDPEAADRSLKALFGTGLFSDVTLRQDGNRLVIR